RDLVRSQHTLLTRELKLDHVFAASGLSMGGMQTFQWVVSYPSFMTKAVPIVGSPKLTAYDLLLWKTELSLIDSPMGLKAAPDHMVNPLTAIEFARATKSELITLTSDCGHLATVCETERLTHEVARFLATP